MKASYRRINELTKAGDQLSEWGYRLQGSTDSEGMMWWRVYRASGEGVTVSLTSRQLLRYVNAVQWFRATAAE